MRCSGPKAPDRPVGSATPVGHSALTPALSVGRCAESCTVPSYPTRHEHKPGPDVGGSRDLYLATTNPCSKFQM